MPNRDDGAVLITGASAGIGRAFANAYARRGHDLVLVARREEPLQEVADILSASQSIKALTLSADLSDPAAPKRLWQEVEDRGISIKTLINNAGFGVPGNLCDVNWARHRATIEVMATAPVHLTQLFAPSMVRQGGGEIINVASLSALLPPHAGGTLYYPVKSFLYQFSLAIREELRSGGVHVTALCPGFTETSFQKAAGGSVESVEVPRWMWSRPEDVARVAIAAVERNKAVCVPGLLNKVIATGFKLMPGPLGRWLVRSDA
ncbi:SDR family NAD(P)-dependent oxidoreductase [Lutimaribacter marinistellae]|uniref:SDR family NAD(P)-dependent oxidoreductase n=1 Tax=Lutimaribacter marinistellae TaxID=1820329 RepID=A0ABV7TIU2_9RHOB